MVDPAGKAALPRALPRAASPPPSVDDRLDWPGSGFSARSRRVVQAFAEALLADEDEAGNLLPPSRALCDRAIAELDHAVGRSSSDLRRGFGLLTFLLDWLPLFVIGDFSRMSRLPLGRRITYLETMETSKFGWFPLLVVAIKVPLTIPAFEQEELLRETGFDRADTAAKRVLPEISREAAVEERS
ncbi:MAG: hypothetical protein ABI193_11075 [Minicystis sp.]